MKNWRPGRDERGVALPMAMITMGILTSLMVVFAVLGTSEPQIAGNHMASIQARALAESGLERALWALTQGEVATPPGGALVNSGPPNYTIALAPPYDGATFVVVSSIGGFKVKVDSGAACAPACQINEKVVTAVGYVPNDTKPTAVKKITARVTRTKWIDPVCGLCSGAESPNGTTPNIKVGGNAHVNATTSAHGGLSAGAFCSGVTPVAAAATTKNGTVTLNGNPDLYAPPYLEGEAAVQTNATFPDTMTFSDADMATLKSLAKAKGTYYQGAQNWTSPPPNGIIFIDTPSGNPLTNASPESDLFTVDIHGNWGTGWSGWLIVAGSIHISGQVTMRGLIYAQNDISLNGTGGGGITGAVISTNRKDTLSSTIADSVDVGNAPLVYDCQAVRSGGGQISQNWFVKPGSYQELSGS
jgi:hypothetical protein